MFNSNRFSYCCTESKKDVTDTRCYKPCSSPAVSGLGSSSTQYGWVATGKTCNDSGFSTVLECGAQRGTVTMTCDASSVGQYCCNNTALMQCGGGTSGGGIQTVKTEWYCAAYTQDSTSCAGYTSASSGSGSGGGYNGSGLPGIYP